MGLRLAENVDELELEDEETFDFVNDNDDVITELGYIRDEIVSVEHLSLFSVFSSGILAGLIMGVVLWKKF